MALIRAGEGAGYPPGDVMTARILIVDDIASNVKLLEIKLSTEHYDVQCAFNGPECLARIEAEIPDVVLLDVMMPGMDGIEVCRRIRSDPHTAHLPVLIVTALNQTADRVAGLEAGADDIITKPVDDEALFARIRGMMRWKSQVDDLLARHAASSELLNLATDALMDPQPRGCILMIEDRAESVAWFTSALAPVNKVTSVDTVEEALVRVRSDSPDLVAISLGMQGFDGLHLCAQLRSSPQGRNVPIMAIVSDGDRRKLMQALEIGIDDYLTRPVDKNELLARTKSQLRKKHFTDILRNNAPLGESDSACRG
jgi:two-component system, cell cycle response regulator